MATLIPSFNQCGTRMTGGEKRFAHRVIDKLENDYCVGSMYRSGREGFTRTSLFFIPGEDC